MASKRRIRRKACAGKNRHLTAWGASIELSKASHANNRERLRAYRCRFCGGWHLGHAPRRQSEAT